MIIRPIPKRDCGDYSVGAHLFPFRTEKLSPTAPMVLPYRWESRSSPNTIALSVLTGLFCFKSRETRSVKRDLEPARAGTCGDVARSLMSVLSSRSFRLACQSLSFFVRAMVVGNVCCFRLWMEAKRKLKLASAQYPHQNQKSHTSP